MATRLVMKKLNFGCAPRSGPAEAVSLMVPLSGAVTPASGSRGLPPVPVMAPPVPTAPPVPVLPPVATAPPVASPPPSPPVAAGFPLLEQATDSRQTKTTAGRRLDIDTSFAGAGPRRVRAPGGGRER